MKYLLISRVKQPFNVFFNDLKTGEQYSKVILPRMRFELDEAEITDHARRFAARGMVILEEVTPKPAPTPAPAPKPEVKQATKTTRRKYKSKRRS